MERISKLQDSRTSGLNPVDPSERSVAAYLGILSSIMSHWSTSLLWYLDIAAFPNGREALTQDENIESAIEMLYRLLQADTSMPLKQ